MPKATTQEEANWPLDSNRAYRAKLISVEERHKEGGVSRKTGKEYDAFTNWLWKFEVSEGEKAGQWAWIETEDKITTRDDNKVKILTGALLQMEVEMGFELDTDDLLDLECFIYVANLTYTKGDGSTGYKTPIIGASSISEEPTQAADDPWAGGGDEPPF